MIDLIEDLQGLKMKEHQMIMEPPDLMCVFGAWLLIKEVAAPFHLPKEGERVAELCCYY